MSIVKYFTYLCLSFVVTICLTFFIYYEDIKRDAVKEFTQQNLNTKLYLEELLNNTLLDNNFNKIDSSIKTFLSIEFFKNIEIEYQRYIFSKNAILLNSNKINNESYRLSDVTTDYKFGEIVSLGNNIYEFIPNVYFNIKDPVLIKFQAFGSGEVYNSTSTLHFYKSVKDTLLDEQKEQDSFLDNMIGFEDITIDKNIVLNYKDKEYVTVRYTVNKKPLMEKTQIFIKKIFIYSMSLFFITIIILYFFYIQVMKKDIEKPISKIEEYIEDILNNKYVRLEKIETKLMHIDVIFEKIQLMSKKVASLTNESNINKELLKRKDFIDEVTGLDNKKVFLKDMKTMFVSNKSGYIVIAKINDLGAFANKNGSNEANILIKDFGHSLIGLLKEFPKINSSVYRFFGAEFALIIESKTTEEIKMILDTISHKIQDAFKSKYLLDGEIVHFGATPFDHYGTTDSILHSAHDSYIKANSEKNSLFAISDNSELIEKARVHEALVEDIIKREDFTIKFIFDTFEMDSDEMIMQEASPIIINSQTFEMFPIGIFISVAEQIKLSSVFDRILIEKVISYLEYEKSTHKIAINLSIDSLTDKKFLSWLEGFLLYNDIAKEHLIFSVTSYNAKENLMKFKNLIEIVHKFDSQILLKRFSLEDFALEELDDLEIDYIRLDKDYCQAINGDREKKHSAKSIILYGEMHEINILGDSIKADEDYKTMSRLGLYATSR